MPQSFWPSLAAPEGQTSTHLPQATQFSVVTSARKVEAERLGLLKSWEQRRPKQEPTVQLQMPKISSGPSPLVIWCI